VVQDKELEQKIYANSFARIQSYYSGNEKILKKLNNGYIAQMTPETEDKIQNDSDIAIVEKDQDINIAESIIDIKTPIETKAIDKFLYL